MSISVKNISVSFDGRKVLDDFSLEIPETGTVCIFGPSGCGKTTLFDVLAGLIQPDSGTVHGMEHKSISMVFEDNRLLPWFDSTENVAVVIGGDTIRAKHALEQMELSEYTDLLPAELSGGMQRRLAIARAIAFNGDILMLDEPTKGLDEELSYRVMDILHTAWTGRLTFLITHERDIAERYSDIIWNVAGPPLRLLDTSIVTTRSLD
ncbi:MAG: ABC transporter ATP-binding protein [Actinobacteria bacterium]|nr:ABC transporter ATP-binding protein [Actinomycetota bacterium]